MARLIRALQRSASRFWSAPHEYRSLGSGLVLSKQRYVEPWNAVARLMPGFRSCGSVAVNSPFESKMRRIIQKEIEYQMEPVPPSQPATRSGDFEVIDKPGNQMTELRGKFGESENIEIEVGMFDGCIFVPMSGEDSTGTNRHMHLSMLIHIKKKEGLNQLKVICSAWPDCLEIQKIAVVPRYQSHPTQYMGPYIKSLDDKIQIPIYEYLEERGISDELASLLHEYMKNKDRIELIRWFQRVQLLVEQ